MAQQLTIIDSNAAYISRARREDFDCTHHKEKIKLKGYGYVNYYELITAQGIHESNHHFVPRKYVQICANQKIKYFKTFKNSVEVLMNYL